MSLYGPACGELRVSFENTRQVSELPRVLMPNEIDTQSHVARPKLDLQIQVQDWSSRIGVFLCWCQSQLTLASQNIRNEQPRSDV